MECRTEPARTRAAATARPPLVREFLLVAGLFLVHRLGRTAAAGHTAVAYRNAHLVWDRDRILRLPGAAALLLWLYLRPAHYVPARRALTALAAAALLPHLAFPPAPPRLLDVARLVDTGQLYGPTVHSAAPTADSLANQFAAMPSPHFGWALPAAALVVLPLPHRTATTAGQHSKALAPVEEPVLVGAGR
jgi:hypothetical protein